MENNGSMDELLQQIETLLSENILLQKKYVERICSVCDDPCCKRVQHLFDEKDVLFLKLSGLRVNNRKRFGNKKGCAFISERGCTLEPQKRPLICHRYICENLENEMAKRDDTALPELKNKFLLIDDLRGRLWATYLELKLD